MTILLLELVEMKKTSKSTPPKKTSTLNAKDIRRSENTAEVLMNILNKIKGFSSTIQKYKSSLFDIHHVIKRWKVNEMSFCDKLLEKCSEFATATETAIGKIHVLTGNLKKRFITASADTEEEKRIKKRKRENATKSAQDTQKRLVTLRFGNCPSLLSDL